MPITGAILKFVIGAVTVMFIVGIFIIISGINELKRVTKNNSLNPIAIEEKGDEFLVRSFDGGDLLIKNNQVKKISTSQSDTMSYLNYEEGGEIKKICLGLIEFSEVRKFNAIVENQQ